MYITSKPTDVNLVRNLDKIQAFVEGPLTQYITEQYGYPVTAKIAFAKNKKLTIKISVNEIDDIQCHNIVTKMDWFYWTLENPSLMKAFENNE